MKTMTHDEWQAEAIRRFGDDAKTWRFECVSCKHPQTFNDFAAAGVDKETINRVLAFSCVGRFSAGVGCDWTLGGLFTLHTLEVVFPDGYTRPTFEFAPGAP